MSETIAVVATGGTIACTLDEHGALVPTVSAAELVDAALSLSAVPRVNTRAIDSVRLDSSSLTLPDLDDLLQRVHALLADASIAGVVITHGTDSMEDTAMALELFHIGDKPVVITGAQRSFDHPDSDGPQNLADAIAYATTGAPGVSIRFGGLTVPARGAFKSHTSSLEAFAAVPTPMKTRPTLALTPLAGNDVVIISAWPGASRTMVDAAVASGAGGIIVEAMGSGNMGSQMGEGVADALEAGIPILITTRVPEGSVSLAYGGSGGGATLARNGALGTGILRAGQARMMLLAALATGTDVAELL
ncbi:asparaginase [Corynebacterium casei]|uniref:asparaginase n=2 Tax=Corynebacterium casei TaxID=160386 RepID=G7HV45_9CORY|nr:asparaginase [Corynebacterium casei]AHI19697.1 L-asparaginase [Corynebacterium casei LMG S-19264]CCE54060.1 L-asparaginase [Corynebacterium casei UCMA 3821]